MFCDIISVLFGYDAKWVYCNLGVTQKGDNTHGFDEKWVLQLKFGLLNAN